MRLTEDDSALVQAAQSGDMDAFALLLVRHRPVLLALCRRTLGNPALAEDAAQEAALRALLHVNRLRQANRFGPWLAGIGLNVCRLWLRTRARECWSWDALVANGGRGATGAPPEAERGPRTFHLIAASGTDGDPAAQAAAGDLAASVRAAVGALPQGQRAAVQFFYLSELSYRETAERLGIAEGAVRTRLHKARETLRGRLRIVGEEEDIVMTDTHQAEDTTVRREETEEHICSFCGKRNGEVQRMIAGPPPRDAVICNECIALCNQIIAGEEAKAAMPL